MCKTETYTFWEKCNFGWKPTQNLGYNQKQKAMMILLKKLGEEKQLGVVLSNIRYLEEYTNNHSKIHLNDSNQALYIEESLEEICEIINLTAKKHTISINVYHQKSLFGQ